jgi:myo-inositol-1(or 4)-monophosphatase
MNTILEILEQAARSAGTISLSYFRKESHIAHKNNMHQNLVTLADTESQKKIQETITTLLTRNGVDPADIGFIGEENLETPTARHMFVIDPLDGTGNFASGLDYFSVSIAYFENGMPTAGLVYWPSRDIVYYAEKGKGAWKHHAQGQAVQIKVADEALKNSLVLMYLSAIPKYFSKTAETIAVLAPSIRGIRLYGSTCLDVVHVADNENAAHLLVNSHLYLWDIAAVYVILREAGGVAYDFDGNEIALTTTSKQREFNAIAGHPHIVQSCLQILRTHQTMKNS